MKKLNELNVKERLRRGFGTVIAGILVISAMSIPSLFNSIKVMKQMNRETSIVVHDTMAICSDINNICKELRGAVIEKDYSKFSSSINKSAADVSESVNRIKPFIEDEEKISAFEQSFKDGAAIRKQIVSLLESGDYEKGAVIIEEEYIPSVNDTFKKAEKLRNAAMDKSNYLERYNVRRTYGTIIFNVIIIIGIIIASVKMSKIIVRGIVTPLENLKDIAGEISKGNLNVAISDEQLKMNDEFGEFANLFNDMITSLNRYVSDISYILGEISNKDFTVKSSIEYNGDFVQIKKSLQQIIGFLEETFKGIKSVTKEVAFGVWTGF